MDIRVPHLAEGVESGTVVAVLVKEGEKVSKNQNLLELETNKAVANIPSETDGVVLEIFVKEGAQVNVGQVLISISENGQSNSGQTASNRAGKATPQQSSSLQTPSASVPAAFQTLQPGAYQYHSSTGAPPPASPSVRRMARELGIDLTRVQGTELGGRITMADVRNYIAALQQLAVGGTVEAEKKPVVSIDFSKWGAVSKTPMTQLRKTISQAMVNSWTTIPHVTQFDDIDITLLQKLRKKHEKEYDDAGARLTLTSLILKAIVKSLQKYSVFNASIDESTYEIVYKKYFHIGIAVDTEHGLMVPVMRDVDKKSFLQISKELQELAQKTRERKLTVEDMKGGSFTISNQGGIGGKYFTPIINKPEVAILGIGRGYLLNEKIVMPVGLSYDHRLIDGGSAARFIVDFAETINQFTDEDLALASKSSQPSKKGKQ